MRSLSTMTDFAKKIQEQEQKKEEEDRRRPFLFHETLDHDGYDEEGPKSNLWDLYVIDVHDSNDKSTVRHFHREDWYIHKEQHDQHDQHYQFMEEVSLSHMTHLWESSVWKEISYRMEQLRKGTSV